MLCEMCSAAVRRCHEQFHAIMHRQLRVAATHAGTPNLLLTATNDASRAGNDLLLKIHTVEIVSIKSSWAACILAIMPDRCTVGTSACTIRSLTYCAIEAI